MLFDPSPAKVFKPWYRVFFGDGFLTSLRGKNMHSIRRSHLGIGTALICLALAIQARAQDPIFFHGFQF